MKMASTVSSWLCAHNTKNMLLKIVHPGGRVELHDCPILASEIMSRNPRCCVAYPHVFRHPWAVVSPDTVLLLGQKFYVVPIHTLRKLQQLSSRTSGSYQLTPRSDDEEDDVSCWVFSNWNSSKKYCNCLNQRIPGETRKEVESPDERCFMCFVPGHRLRLWVESSDSRKVESTESNRITTGETNKGSPLLNFKNHVPEWQPSLESIIEEH